MPSNRIQRTNEDIQRVLAALIPGLKDPRLSGSMLSIVRTETTGDLRYCKVYISALGGESDKEIIKGLKSASGYLRRELGSRLSLRYTPELIFQLDKSIAYGAHINEILNSLDIHDEGDAEDDD